MSKFLIAGNWKMNTNAFEAEKLSGYVAGYLKENPARCEVLMCPPFTSIASVGETVKGSHIKLGAQNCYHEQKGAFTGEISINMLRYIDVTYIIIGHSERRKIFGETDELINKKIKAVLDAELTPVFCIGETIDERNAGKTYEVIEKQITSGLNGIPAEKIAKCVIAYEPVWAIGTGISATPEQAGEAHTNIRSFLKDKYGEEVSAIKLLYGGSMNEKNCRELLSLKDVDGGLIGGASIKGDSFIEIIRSADELS
jgi:triosephosphate isomerase